MNLLEKLHQKIAQSDWAEKFKEEEKMNIDKIKEYIALRKDLSRAGVIGLNIHEDEVHLEKSLLIGQSNLQISPRHGDEKYPHQISVVREGIKLFCITTNEELQEFFPELSGYMIEDVDLSGEEIA